MWYAQRWAPYMSRTHFWDGIQNFQIVTDAVRLTTDKTHLLWDEPKFLTLLCHSEFSFSGGKMRKLYPDLFIYLCILFYQQKCFGLNEPTNFDTTQSDSISKSMFKANSTRIIFITSQFWLPWWLSRPSSCSPSLSAFYISHYQNSFNVTRYLFYTHAETPIIWKIWYIDLLTFSHFL